MHVFVCTDGCTSVQTLMPHIMQNCSLKLGDQRTKFQLLHAVQHACVLDDVSEGGGSSYMYRRRVWVVREGLSP